MKELSVMQMEEINGGSIVCEVAVGVVAGLLCGFWCGVAADILICPSTTAS